MSIKQVDTNSEVRDELSIDDLDRVTGGGHAPPGHGNGTGGGDGLGWVRNLLRGVVGSLPSGNATPSLNHEDPHSS
jgi:hypothetical protein